MAVSGSRRSLDDADCFTVMPRDYFASELLGGSSHRPHWEAWGNADLSDQIPQVIMMGPQLATIVARRDAYQSRDLTSGMQSQTHGLLDGV